MSAPQNERLRLEAQGQTFECGGPMTPY